MALCLETTNLGYAGFLLGKSFEQSGITGAWWCTAISLSTTGPPKFNRTQFRALAKEEYKSLLEGDHG
jgi:hypothetical protein